jgi:hypothetical protein
MSMTISVQVEIADLALDQTEAGIDVGGEGVEEGVKDADIVHLASPAEGVAGAAAPDGHWGATAAPASA